MAEELTADICVVGGGPAGIAVALAAAAEGVPVILAEKETMGGANLACGGVPLQALATAATVNESLRRGPAIGVTGAPLQVNFAKVREHMTAVAAALAANVAPERLTALGVKVVRGAARFATRDKIAVGDTTIRARRFVLAVGSLPAPPALPGLSEVETLSIGEVFDLARRPSHLLVLGGTPYGLALAQAMSRLGVDSTVIDEAPALAGEDPELAAILLDRLGADGVRVRAGVAVASIARRRGGIRIMVGDGEGGEVAVDGSHLVVATGRCPAVEGLGLEVAGVAHDANGIVVDRSLRTANRHVYAIGDAIAGEASVARAEHEAAQVARAILFRASIRADRAGVPRITPTDPALASVGLGEEAARKRHRTLRVLRFPFAENDRAQAERMPAGVLKVMTTAGGRILGAAILGHGAEEQIALWSLAIANRLPLDAIRTLPMPYPSRTEVARRLALGAAGVGLTSSARRRIIGLLRKFG